jgi:WD40 repeat protein
MGCFKVVCGYSTHPPLLLARQSPSSQPSQQSALIFCPHTEGDGTQVVSASEDGTVKLWDVGTFD